MDKSSQKRSILLTSADPKLINEISSSNIDEIVKMKTEETENIKHFGESDDMFFETQKAKVSARKNESGEAKQLTLLEKKRFVQQEKAKLEQKRKEIAERIRVCQEKEKEYEIKSIAFTEQRAKFLTLVSSQEDQRVKTLNRVCEDQHIINALKDEIHKKEEELSVMTKKNEEYESEERMLTPYYTYLSNAVKSSDFFVSTMDILMRFDTLERALQHLDSTNEINKNKITELQRSVKGKTKEVSDRVFILESKIAEKEKELEETREYTHSAESSAEIEKQRFSEGIRQLDEIKRAIINLNTKIEINSEPFRKIKRKQLPDSQIDSDDKSDASIVRTLSRIELKLIDIDDIVNQLSK